MANIQFQFYTRAPAATLSGGSWLVGAPLANLKVDPPELSLRARSTNLLLASTKLNIDLGTTNVSVRMIGVAVHNLSRDARIRFSGGTTSGGSDVYSSGWLDVWPAVYLPEDLEWEDDNWWTGRISAEQAEGYPAHGMHDTGANYLARYWTIEIDDPTNSDGYVEIGHLRLGPVWSPERNFAPGAAFGWEPRDVSERSLGGVTYSEERPPARVLRIVLRDLSEIEAFGAVLDAQRRLGTRAPFFVVQDPDDAARALQRNFLARFRKADPITQAFIDVHEVVLEMEEWL
jgi:hypothetical protein